MKKIKRSFIILSAYGPSEGEGEDVRPEESNDYCFDQPGAVLTGGWCAHVGTLRLSWQPGGCLKSARSPFSHWGQQRPFHSWVIAQTKGCVLPSQTLCWTEAHNPFMGPEWTLPRTAKHLRYSLHLHTSPTKPFWLYPPKPSRSLHSNTAQCLPSNSTLWQNQCFFSYNSGFAG